MEPEAPDLEKWGGKWDGHAFKTFNKYKISQEYQSRKNSNPPHPASERRRNPRNSVTMGRASICTANKLYKINFRNLGLVTETE